jgi:hypothetical protein
MIILNQVKKIDLKRSTLQLLSKTTQPVSAQLLSKPIQPVSEQLLRDFLYRPSPIKRAP